LKLNRPRKPSRFIPHAARFTSRFIQPHAAHTRALGLAARILARYSLHLRWGGNPGMDMLQQRISQVGGKLAAYLSMHLAFNISQHVEPRIRNNYYFRHPVEPAKKTSELWPGLLIVNAAQAMSQMIIRYARKEPGEGISQPAMPQIFNAPSNHEKEPMNASISRQEQSGTSLIQPITHVVRRRSQPADELQAEPSKKPLTVTALQPEVGNHIPSAKMIRPASLDINLLTDQVIRQIDHRITAQRERLGKV
jgi:hypothetical protein